MKNNYYNSKDTGSVTVNDHNSSISHVLKDIKIQSIVPEIIQCPNNENGFHAIVKSTITTQDNKTISELGEVYASDSLSKADVLKEAQINALSDAASIIRAIQDINTQDYKPDNGGRFGINNSAPELVSKNTSDKNKFNGGGNKPASDKQKNLINSLAKQKQLSAEEECMQLCNVHLNNLSGAQADMVIKKLKEEESIY